MFLVLRQLHDIFNVGGGTDGFCFEKKFMDNISQIKKLQVFRN
jgi:hypothetical protein|tara:strand:+ start:3735 stop:3863 length:129 start_codon:yes stop_codon:yes gene_type:complete